MPDESREPCGDCTTLGVCLGRSACPIWQEVMDSYPDRQWKRDGE